MIVRIVFSDEKVMMFGDSYKPWKMQMDEFMRRCAEGLEKPISATFSKEKWIAWGGLKWCGEDSLQKELNQEGRQDGEPDNPNARKYENMEFNPIKNKVFAEILDAWEAGQRMLVINKLSDEEYKRYSRGELKISIGER